MAYQGIKKWVLEDWFTTTVSFPIPVIRNYPPVMATISSVMLLKWE